MNQRGATLQRKAAQRSSGSSTFTGMLEEAHQGQQLQHSSGSSTFMGQGQQLHGMGIQSPVMVNPHGAILHQPSAPTTAIYGQQNSFPFISQQQIPGVPGVAPEGWYDLQPSASDEDPVSVATQRLLSMPRMLLARRDEESKKRQRGGRRVRGGQLDSLTRTAFGSDNGDNTVFFALKSVWKIPSYLFLLPRTIPLHRNPLSRPQKESTCNDIAKEAWATLRSSTPFLKNDETLQASFINMGTSKLFIVQNGQSGWKALWDGGETLAGGKHYIYRKFRDNRITWAQTLVSDYFVFHYHCLNFLALSPEEETLYPFQLCTYPGNRSTAAGA